MHLKRRWIDRRVYEYFSVNIAPLLGWRDPILIYQMGKVGSSSIRNSLFRCQDPGTRLVLMSHEFFPIRNRDLARIEIEPEYKDYVIREIEHDRRVFRQFPLRKRLGWRFREKFYTERIYRAYVKPKHQLRVITLVREPIANNVSMFFQLIDHYIGTPIEESSHDIETIIQIFVQRYMHSRPLTWFDAEVKTTLGVDVFQYPFPIAKGYNIISSGNVSLLVLKCELDDQSKAGAIAEFLGLEYFEIVRSNVTGEKSHARQYAEFKQRLRVPDWLLDQMYESKYARFFYSDDERSCCRDRWSGRTAKV
jgi:hypothetical protein